MIQHNKYQGWCLPQVEGHLFKETVRTIIHRKKDKSSIEILDLSTMINRGLSIWHNMLEELNHEEHQVNLSTMKVSEVQVDQELASITNVHVFSQFEETEEKKFDMICLTSLDSHIDIIENTLYFNGKKMAKLKDNVLILSDSTENFKDQSKVKLIKTHEQKKRFGNGTHRVQRAYLFENISQEKKKIQKTSLTEVKTETTTISTEE